jgi:hypothetical protein
MNNMDTVEADDAKLNIASDDALVRLFGPPPVFSSENLARYHELLAGYVAQYKPRGAIEWLFIREATDAVWQFVRHTRVKHVAMDRGLLKGATILASDARERADEIEHEQKKAELIMSNEAEQFADACFWLDEEEADVYRINVNGKYFYKFPFDQLMKTYERLDRLCIRALRRRDNALDSLERYRAGLGRRLREITDEMIEIACNSAVPEKEIGSEEDSAKSPKTGGDVA